MSWVRTGQGVALAILIALASAAITAVALIPQHVNGAALPPRAVAATIPSPDTLTVVGQGEAKAAPDQANVSLGVSATRPSVSEALSVAGSDMNNLLASLHAQGVQDQDIQTTGISASQDNTCCPRYVTGYSASGTVSVLVHHLGNVDPLVAAAVTAVGNDIQLNGMGLSVSDTSAAAKTARTAAMSDAAARANTWVSLAGRHLGRILAVSEQVIPGGSGCAGCGGAGGGGGIPIAAGQNEIVLSITVEYELLS